MESLRQQTVEQQQTIEQLLQIAESFAREAVTPNESESIDQKMEIRVTVSPTGDRATLALCADPPQPYPFTEEIIHKALQEQGVVEGIREQVIQEIVSKEQFVSDAIIAQGRPAIEGEDARIEFLFDPAPKPYSLESTERIDWHDLRLFQTVAAGHPVARKIPGRPGEPGTTVDGNTLAPRKIRDVRLPMGRGTTVNPNDPNELIAVEGGAVSLAGNKVIVDKVLSIGGDVDFSVGNVSIDGSVMIGGNVLPGFQVRASGDVHIAGNVEAAWIEAAGSIWITRGVLGHNKTLVKAGKDVQIKFATNAEIRAGGNITIQTEAVNCRLDSGGTISVGTREGTHNRIVGGQLSATTRILAVDLGSEGHAPTSLIIAPPKEPCASQKERELIVRLNQLRDNQSRVAAQIAKLLQARYSGALLWNEANIQLYSQLSAASGQLEEAIQELEYSVAECAAEQPKSPEPRAVVYGTIYPGVQLTIGALVRRFRDEMSHVQITVDRESASLAIVPI